MMLISQFPNLLNYLAIMEKMFHEFSVTQIHWAYWVNIHSSFKEVTFDWDCFMAQLPQKKFNFGHGFNLPDPFKALISGFVNESIMCYPLHIWC